MKIEIDKSVIVPISKIREIADSDPAPIEACGFSKRTIKALKEYGINTVEDLIDFEYDWSDITHCYVQKHKINTIPGIGLAGLKEERAMFRSDEDNLYKTILENRNHSCNTRILRHDPLLSKYVGILNTFLKLISLSAGQHLYNVTILMVPNINASIKREYNSGPTQGNFDYFIQNNIMSTKYSEKTLNFIASIFKELGYNVSLIFVEDEWSNSETNEYIKVCYLTISWEDKK